MGVSRSDGQNDDCITANRPTWYLHVQSKVADGGPAAQSKRLSRYAIVNPISNHLRNSSSHSSKYLVHNKVPDHLNSHSPNQ